MNAAQEIFALMESQLIEKIGDEFRKNESYFMEYAELVAKLHEQKLKKPSLSVDMALGHAETAIKLLTLRIESKMSKIEFGDIAKIVLKTALSTALILAESYSKKM